MTETDKERAERLARKARAKVLLMFPPEYRSLAEAYAALCVADQVMHVHSSIAELWTRSTVRAQEAVGLALPNGRAGSRTDHS
jgi:hypothetical protein